MSQHTNYQPARKGLVSHKIAAEKAFAVHATAQNKDSKGVVMTALYGSCRTDAHRAVLDRIGPNPAFMNWLEQRRYSDQGDFTRCYRGGF
jgi:hypothetical protein